MSNPFKSILQLDYIKIHLAQQFGMIQLRPAKEKQRNSHLKSYEIGYSCSSWLPIKKKVPPPLPRAIQPSELRWRILHTHGAATEVEPNSCEGSVGSVRL